MAHGGADTIGPGIAAADDNDVFAFGRNKVAILMLVEKSASVVSEEFHGEMDSLELAAFDR